MLKELDIADIKVGSRHRKDMGSLTSLAERQTRCGGELDAFVGIDMKFAKDLLLPESVCIRQTEGRWSSCHPGCRNRGRVAVH